MLRQLILRGVSLSNPVKTGILVMADTLIVVLCFLATAMIETRSLTPRLFLIEHWQVIVLAVGVYPLALSWARVYSMVLRHGGERLLLSPLFGVLGGTAVVVLLGLALDPVGFDLWRTLGAGGLSLASIVALRTLIYVLISHAQSMVRVRHERVAIYGVGTIGVSLMRAMRSNALYKVVALIDDGQDKRGRHVHGLKVYGGDQLDELMVDVAPETVIIAIPRLTIAQRRAILERLEPLPVRVRILPTLLTPGSGESLLDQVRDVSAQELLMRDPVEPIADLLTQDVRDRVVLVSGGGGSIGLEICRQALALGPRRLVILEQSEFALYEAERELRDLMVGMDAPVDVRFVLGSVCDGRLVQNTLAGLRVETIYHAAAYKHVPIVEDNVIVGLSNNVLGTLTLAQAARETGCTKFVLISTDKAVRPTNVMGASKRMAEMVLQALAKLDGPTVFTMVRFGNVLDSKGSVVPLFRRQIARGGPVTVTHRDITRYFMTIAEATQLVLQAGAMARGGEVFLLDMGEPVRIYDLARRLIHLSGLTVRDEDNPEGHIPVEVIGLRPGEKLYEELIIAAASEDTAHPRVMRACEQGLDWDTLSQRLEQMKAACARRDAPAALRVLVETVPDYTPDSGVRAILEAATTVPEEATVVPLVPGVARDRTGP